MKKYFSMMAMALAAVALVSCSDSDDPTPGPDTGGGDDNTKTTLATPAPSASNVTESSATLSWTAVANAGSYSYSVNGAEKTTLGTTVTVDGLTANTAYTFKVKAVPSNTNDYAESAYGQVSFTTSAADVPTPGPTPGETPASLSGSQYILIVLGEGTKEAYLPAEKIVADWRTDDYTKFNYIWENTYVAGVSTGPNCYGIVEGWTSLIYNNIGWAGGGFCVGVTAADGSGAEAAVLQQLNTLMPKLTSEDGWYLHFAMKSSDAQVHAIRLYPVPNNAVTLNVGAPGQGYDFELPRDGEWYEFEVEMKSLVGKGLYYTADAYTKGENVVGYGVPDPAPALIAGYELHLDAVFFYKK